MSLKRILFCFLMFISSLFIKLNVFADINTINFYGYINGSTDVFSYSDYNDLSFDNALRLIKYLKEDLNISFVSVIGYYKTLYFCNNVDFNNNSSSDIVDFKYNCVFDYYLDVSNFNWMLSKDDFNLFLNSLVLSNNNAVSKSKIFDIISVNGEILKYYTTYLFWQDGSLMFPNFNDVNFNNLNYTSTNFFTNYLPYGIMKFTDKDNKIISFLYRHFGFYYSSSVVDVEAPMINLIGNNEINIEINSIFNDPGYNCTDNVDSSCTVIVSGNVDTSKLGSYTLTYSATDLAGNNTKSTRIVNVIDSINPVITLFGDSIIYCNINGEYDELGASVTDNSNEILDVVIDSSLLDIRKVGDYKISYSACDSSGNCTTIYRLVKVQSTIPVDFSGSQYLLFNFSDIQDLFPNINFSGVSNSDQFVITIIFNIFFVIFIFFFIYLFIKVINKIISIVFH